jgi:ribosome recycling factor
MDTSEYDLEMVIEEHRENCVGAINAFRRELQKVRTGRASTGLVEGLTVDYYGSKTPLGHLGQISTPEARTILIQAYDAKSCPAIEKAIQSSSLGLNPSRDGNTIRINIPPLTEESRKEIVRMLNKMAEDIRISIRNHRRDANEMIKRLEKDSQITKDDNKRSQEKIQKQTDKHIADVDVVLKAKEEECMEV